MVAAGIISRARVYAGRQDPFYLPKRLRYLALAKYGKDLDDDASHSRAAVMLTPVGKSLREKFLDHRETIMAAVAMSCWPKDSSFLKEKWKDSTQRQKVKTLFHTKDMRGSTLAWCHKQGLSDTTRAQPLAQ